MTWSYVLTLSLDGGKCNHRHSLEERQKNLEMVWIFASYLGWTHKQHPNGSSEPSRMHKVCTLHNTRLTRSSGYNHIVPRHLNRRHCKREHQVMLQ
jgi:hypothetical protein